VIQIFPVRHHSPSAALHVQRLIVERKPRAVLVEGPVDATPLIPLLLDPDTKPPVALYAYGGGRQVRAAFYPYCQYSPEYVALKAGLEVGALLRFCDVPAGVSLAERDEDPTSAEPAPEPNLTPEDYSRFAAALTQAADLDTYEEFWEVAFEQDAGRRPTSDYIDVLSDFGSRVRTFTVPERDSLDSLRERHMAAVAREIVACGVPPEEVLVVCGAAHVAAIAEAYAAELEPPPVAPATQAVVTLIPFSFPRLSEQSGYGAGNRAPWYYQQVWERGDDYEAATREALVLLADHLRRQGYMASLAQVIDAYNLAVSLSRMRRKPGPGVDELQDAAVACLGQGHPSLVEAALRRVLIGDAIGRITARVGRTPLQTEFYASAQRLGLPVVDAPRQVLVHPAVPKEAEQSILLHRLAVADIPFARELESGLAGRGRSASDDPLEQLGRVREKWELQWTPATDAQLIERTAWGSSLAEVCGRLLRDQLTSAPTIDAGTVVLLRMALCDLPEPFTEALKRCEALAADSGSFAALARATYHLDGLLGYGSARRLPVTRLAELARRLFARAAVHLPASAVCGDHAATDVERALTPLYELVRRGSPTAEAPDAFWESVGTVAEMAGSHPTLRGLCLLLLEVERRLEAGELAGRLRYWLSATAEAADGARLVSGLFCLHRGTMLRNRSLIGAITEFLLELEIEQLTPLLPVLRRSLGNLSSAERAYLTETLAAVLRTDADTARATLRVTSEESALLRESDAAVAAILAEWKEQYGIE
jgi:hypothetical protein